MNQYLYELIIIFNKDKENPSLLFQKKSTIIVNRAFALYAK